MTYSTGWQYGMCIGDLINKPSLSYEVNHDKKYAHFRIQNHPDRFMAIKLDKESMIKMARELQTILEWENEDEDEEKTE